MDRWSFILGVAVAIILRKVVDVLGEPYHVASVQVGEPKWVQPIKRLMDGGHEANRQLAVGDVFSAVAAQQLHHAHTLANALSASIEAPLALRSAVVGLGVRVLLALAAVWSMAPIARAGVRRLSRPRPAMRSWLAQVEQRLLGSPWLGCLVTGLILAAAVAVIVQAAPPPPPSPPAAAEWHERATHPSAVRPPQEGACAASRARGPVWRGAAVGSAFWHRLVGAKADGCCGSEGCAAPDGSGDEAGGEGGESAEQRLLLQHLGLPLLSALTRLLGGGYRRLAAALRQLRPALCCLGVQASLASLLLLAMRLRQRLQQRDSSNYAKWFGASAANGAATPPLLPPQPRRSSSGGVAAAAAAALSSPTGAERLSSMRENLSRSREQLGQFQVNLESKILDLADQSRRRRMAGLYGLRRLGAAAQLLLCLVPAYELASLWWTLWWDLSLRRGAGRASLSADAAAAAAAAAAGFRALASLCFLLWLQSVGRTCWLLLSLALVRDDATETSFVDAMTFTSIAPRVERLLSAATRGLAIFPPGYVFWYAAALELLNCRGPRLAQMALLGTGLGVSQVLGSATSLAPSAATAALWRGWAEQARALVPLVALLQSAGSFDAPPPRCLLLLAAPSLLSGFALFLEDRRAACPAGDDKPPGPGPASPDAAPPRTPSPRRTFWGDESRFSDVTARNASLRGLVRLIAGEFGSEPLLPDSLLRLKRMHSRVRAAASKASESASLNFLARLLGEGGPIHTALLTSGGSPLPSELLPVARLLLDHSHRVANEPRIGSAVAQLWPMGGSLLASLLHDVFLSQHGRWMLRRGLCALQAQEEEMAPPDEVRFPRELLHGLKKWTLMPAVGVRGCVVAHDDLKADSAVPASRIFSMRDDPRTGQPLPWTPVIRVAARCYTTLGKDGQPVRLVLDTKNLVRIRRVGYFTECSPRASLFNARVTAVHAPAPAPQTERFAPGGRPATPRGAAAAALAESALAGLEAGLAVRAAERTESAARVAAEGRGGEATCTVEYVDDLEVLLAKDDAEQEAEFNFITLIDLPVPPWRMPLHVWMRGMQVDLTMVGSARQGEKLLSLEWEAASPEDEARGRVGSVIICLDVDPLDVAVRLPEIGLRLLGTERHKDLRAKGRNGKIVARLRLAIEKGGALAPAGTQPAALGPGLYLTVEHISLKLEDIRIEASSTVKGGTRTGLVRLAASASGLISAFTPEWMANKLWRPVLTSIEEAIVENNQSNPVLLVQELHLLADVATYLQRAMRRQADRETALEQSLKVKYARRLLARAKVRARRAREDISAAAGISHHGYLWRLLDSPHSVGSALSPEALMSLAAVASSSRATARPQRHRSLEEGGRASLSDGWQSRRSILRASQAAAAGWRRVYVVLGGGRLREYRNLQAARDDIVSRLVLTAQRGSDVRAARVVPPREGREWCLELDVQGLMKALERKTYACETQEGRRRWADCARLEARTPARLSLESAIGQAGHSITSAFSHLRLPLGLRRAHVAPFEEGAATPTRTPPSPVFLSACSHAAAPRGGSRPASPAADPAAEPSEGQARASTASSAPRRLAGACSSATGTEWCKPLPLPPSLAALEPAQRLSGRSPSSPRWQRLAQAKLEEIGKEISKTSEEIGKAAQAKLDEIGKAAGSSQRKAQERVSALVHFAQEQVAISRRSSSPAAVSISGGGKARPCRPSRPPRPPREGDACATFPGACSSETPAITACPLRGGAIMCRSSSSPSTPRGAAAEGDAGASSTETPSTPHNLPRILSEDVAGPQETPEASRRVPPPLARTLHFSVE